MHPGLDSGPYRIAVAELLINVLRAGAPGDTGRAEAVARAAEFGVMVRQKMVMEHSGAGMATEAEKREYENQTVNFFLKSLSLRAN